MATEDGVGVLTVKARAMGSLPAHRLGQLALGSTLVLARAPPLRAGLDMPVREIVRGVVGPPLAVNLAPQTPLRPLVACAGCRQIHLCAPFLAEIGS